MIKRMSRKQRRLWWDFLALIRFAGIIYGAIEYIEAEDWPVREVPNSLDEVDGRRLFEVKASDDR